MNTGHEGGCGTIHANSAADVPARVEALALAAGLSRAAAHSQMASAIHVLIHLGRGHGGQRRVEQIAVLRRAGGGEVRAAPAVTFGLDGTIETHPGADVLGTWLNRP